MQPAFTTCGGLCVVSFPLPACTEDENAIQDSQWTGQMSSLLLFPSRLRKLQMRVLTIFAFKDKFKIGARLWLAVLNLQIVPQHHLNRDLHPLSNFQ